MIILSSLIGIALVVGVALILNKDKGSEPVPVVVSEEKPKV